MKINWRMILRVGAIIGIAIIPTYFIEPDMFRTAMMVPAIIGAIGLVTLIIGWISPIFLPSSDVKVGSSQERIGGERVTVDYYRHNQDIEDMTDNIGKRIRYWGMHLFLIGIFAMLIVAAELMILELIFNSEEFLFGGTY